MTSEVKPRTQVELSRQGNVATIWFATETGVNVFSSQVVSELAVCIEKVGGDPSVRFVVLRGRGKTFVAGADITEMSHFTEDRGLAFSKLGQHAFDAIERLPQVTFAAVNGHAMGGGCEIAMACDFRILVASAKLGQPESRLGLIPGWLGTKRLPRLVGMSNARRLMFSGAAVGADEALRIGLVDEVVASQDELDAALKRWYELMASGSPAAIRRIKHAMMHGDETNQFGMCFSCSDAHEGMAAFLEKRQPVWTGWKDCDK